MLELSFLERVMMDHDHFVLIILADGKSTGILIDLMGEKFTECSVPLHIRYRSKEGLFLCLIFQRNHQQLVVAMWIGELHAAAG